jgi:hypothetical protein
MPGKNRGDLRPLFCPRCEQRLEFVGTKDLHSGTNWGIFGELGELFVKSGALTSTSVHAVAAWSSSSMASAKSFVGSSGPIGDHCVPNRCTSEVKQNTTRDVSLSSFEVDGGLVIVISR